jgi:hypothetical protein
MGSVQKVSSEIYVIAWEIRGKTLPAKDTVWSQKYFLLAVPILIKSHKGDNFHTKDYNLSSVRIQRFHCNVSYINFFSESIIIPHKEPKTCNNARLCIDCKVTVNKYACYLITHVSSLLLTLSNKLLHINVDHKRRHLLSETTQVL